MHYLCGLCVLIVKTVRPTESFKLLLGPFASLQQQLEDVFDVELS